MNKFLVVCLLLTMSSCANLTPAAQKLIVVNDVKYVSYCTQVGIVHSSSSMSGDIGWTAIGNNNSLVQMKNLAAKMGDVLLITRNDESAITGSEREGIVYKCPPNIVFKQVSPN